MTCVISVDLGGTNLRVGLVSVGRTGSDGIRAALPVPPALPVEFCEKLPSEAKAPFEKTLERIADSIRKMASRAEGRSIAGLALGVPGIVDHHGVVHRSPHFPDWKGVDVGGWFRRQFPWPVVVDNDCNMVARGEAWQGAARGLRNFVLLTLGTGVGGAVCWEGEIVHGDSGFAGEIGHMVIEAEGPSCPCGSRGCFEMYVSSTGILHAVEEEKGIDWVSHAKATVESLYRSACDGDIFAHAAFKRMGYYLGIGIASLVNVTGIETVVLGGGVSEAWDFFIEPAKKELAERTYPETAGRVKIRRAELGDLGGLIGGAAAFQNSEA